MREAIQNMLAKNSYFAQAEKILLAALDDSDFAVRRDVVQKIVNENKGIRKLSKESIKVNFAAYTYVNLIDWTCCEITPHLIFSLISNNTLTEAVEFRPVQLQTLPCLTQVVKKVVKDVTRVSTNVYGHNSRNGMLVSTIVSRMKKSKLDAKYSFALQHYTNWGL